MNGKFEMGPLQKLWVKSLREHPERQMSGALGVIDHQTGTYQARCLGELKMCALRSIGENPFNVFYRSIMDGADTASLSVSYEDFGLYGPLGYFDGAALKGNISLANANDAGITWPEIADFIEQNPTAVFTKSV